MTSYGLTKHFAITGIAFICLILFALVRLRIAAAVTQDNKVAFQVTPLAGALTPERAALAAGQAELDATKESEPKQ